MKLVLFIMCLFLISCDIDEYGSSKICRNTQIIDSCEYLVSVNGQGNVITHKGNCKNPIHYKVVHDTIYIEIKTKKK